MKKSVFLINSLLILLLIGSVIAAGSSTGANTDSDESESTQITDEATEPEANDRKLKADRRRALLDKAKRLGSRLADIEKKELRDTCEETTDRKERIKCRLDYIKDVKEEFTSPRDSVPEACRNVDNKDYCKRLYYNAQKCYELEGRDKNKCFKRASGFARAKLKDENPTDRPTKSRDYVVLLLYDLQEKIEHAIENERIDTDKGSEVIDKIVEIKEAILSGKTKEEVKPMIQELRELLKDLKSTIDQDE